MVQPEIGINFLSDALLKDQGLFSRLLISYPPTTSGTRLQREVRLESIQAIDKFKEFNGYVISPDIKLAERLLEWLHNKWDCQYISLPDIYQRSLDAISTKSKAMHIVNILVDHG